MPTFLATPLEITPGSAGSWEDIDISPHVGIDAGSIALAYLQVTNPSSTDHAWGVRKNGSTDDIRNFLEDTGHTWAVIAVDGSDIFEANLDNISDLHIWLMGYATTAEAGNLTNFVDISISVIDTWTDTDISSHTGGDTAILAAVFLRDTGGAVTHGLRENGSTDDRRASPIVGSNYLGAVMACDSNEIFEAWTSATSLEMYLTGWLTSNFTSIVNAIEHSTGTTGSYQETDLSADIPTGNTGAYWQFTPGGAFQGDLCAIRRNGSSFDEVHGLMDQNFGFVEIDGDRKIEQQIANTRDDLWLWGYSSEPAVAVAVAYAYWM